MDDLVEFLRARIAKDEQIARACSGAAWRPSPPGSVSLDTPSGEPSADTSGGSGASGAPGQAPSGRPGFVAEAENETYAEHIARHAPARVLREAAAKRLILDEYAKAAWLLSSGHRSDAAEAAQTVRVAALRALASAYADHPAYRPQWAI
ncbi:DUF6221 family protein [Actinomadura rupiterrae]|uniref:DUF6221 family protein n=1 Tax=Actinomadura rupiterrae TaxID=559627 RepID=UPI0020A2F2E1|nr:DUF6221 family protein [Actinomadura rupiterrae]MCP2343249.1 hypothetical protein [Actinomadura rupiterrae]